MKRDPSVPIPCVFFVRELKPSAAGWRRYLVRSGGGHYVISVKARELPVVAPATAEGEDDEAAPRLEGERLELLQGAGKILR